MLQVGIELGCLPLESSLTGLLQFSVDSAVVHQGGGCGVDELSQAAGKAAGCM